MSRQRYTRAQVEGDLHNWDDRDIDALTDFLILWREAKKSGKSMALVPSRQSAMIAQRTPTLADLDRAHERDKRTAEASLRAIQTVVQAESDVKTEQVKVMNYAATNKPGPHFATFLKAVLPEYERCFQAWLDARKSPHMEIANVPGNEDTLPGRQFWLEAVRHAASDEATQEDWEDLHEFAKQVTEQFDPALAKAYQDTIDLRKAANRTRRKQGEALLAEQSKEALAIVRARVKNVSYAELRKAYLEQTDPNEQPEVYQYIKERSLETIKSWRV